MRVETLEPVDMLISEAGMCFSWLKTLGCFMLLIPTFHEIVLVLPIYPFVNMQALLKNKS